MRIERKSFTIAVAASALAVFAEIAFAGHGAVSYENPLKARQRERRENAPQEQPAAPAAKSPASAAPAAAAAAADPVVDGDADRAFATAARRDLAESVAAAEAQLAAGKDAELRALAKRMLESQRKQLAELDAWLAAHPQQDAAK